MVNPSYQFTCCINRVNFVSIKLTHMVENEGFVIDVDLGVKSEG